MLHVSLLGEQAITRDGTSVQVRSSRGVALVAFLVVHAGVPQARERIAGVLWPESADGQAMLTVQRHVGTVIPVKPLRPLVAAGDALLEAYPLLCGTVTPCALRTITAPGPCVVSAALGVGIAAHRGRDADLFMEDTRVQRRHWPPGRARRRPGPAGCNHREWVGEIAASIVAVGGQQGVLYDEIFAGVTSAEVPAGCFGGAVAGVPYCLLPRAAVPDDPAGLLDPVTWSQARWQARLAPADQPTLPLRSGAARPSPWT
jgi:hypothetical protein